MNKVVYVLSIFCISLISCSKDDTTASPYIGTYNGLIIDNSFDATGTYVDTIKNYTIVITNTSYSSAHVFLHNSLIGTKEGKVVANEFFIDRRLVSKDEFFEVYEWAEGTFITAANTTGTVSFYREIVNTNLVIARITRNGNLTRQ